MAARGKCSTLMAAYILFYIEVALVINKDQWLLDSDSAHFCLDKWQKTVTLMAELYDAPLGLIIQATSQGYQYTSSNFGDKGPYPAGQTYPADANIFAQQVIETAQSLYVPDALVDQCWANNPEVEDEGFRSFMGLPIVWPDGTAFGVICVMDHHITAYGDAFMRLMSHLRDLIEQDLQLWNQFLIERSKTKRNREMSQGAAGLSTLGRSCMHFARRYGLDVGVLSVKVENYSELKQNLSLPELDKALASVGDVLQSSLRGSDVAARMDDDSFVIVALARSEAEVANLHQRLVEQVAKLDLNCELSVSCSEQFYPLDKAPNVEFMLKDASLCA